MATPDRGSRGELRISAISGGSYGVWTNCFNPALPKSGLGLRSTDVGRIRRRKAKFERQPYPDERTMTLQQPDTQLSIASFGADLEPFFRACTLALACGTPSPRLQSWRLFLPRREEPWYDCGQLAWPIKPFGLWACQTIR